MTGKQNTIQNVTQNYSKLHIPTREEFHRQFGGVIYQSDFNTDYRGNDNTNGSIIASRIQSEYRHFAKLRKDGRRRYGWN